MKCYKPDVYKPKWVNYEIKKELKLEKMKGKAFLMVFLFAVGLHCRSQNDIGSKQLNKITFEKSDYGLIFTTILINNRKVKAMIDFGDQHVLQLSSTLASELGVKTEKAGYQVSDVYGNTWDVKRGTVNKLVVGSLTESDVAFTSQEGEIEAVSRQIGTEFHAVLGWGYFSRYFTEIDYSNSTFTLSDNRGFFHDAIFSVPFNKDANQLIIKAKVNGQEVNFMIDTGSPVTVVDPEVLVNFQGEEFGFVLQSESFKVKAYEQDLSILSDLEVVCILGGDFLADWKIVIDPERSLLHFKK